MKTRRLEYRRKLIPVRYSHRINGIKIADIALVLIILALFLASLLRA